MERRAIHAAVNEWDDALGGNIIFYIADESEVRPSTLVTRPIASLSIDCEPADSVQAKVDTSQIAWVPRVGDAEIHVVRERVYHYDLRGIIAHEIGHSLGLPHSIHRGNLMGSPLNNACGCVDGHTLSRLAAL